MRTHRQTTKTEPSSGPLTASFAMGCLGWLGWAGLPSDSVYLSPKDSAHLSPLDELIPQTDAKDDPIWCEIRHNLKKVNRVEMKRRRKIEEISELQDKIQEKHRHILRLRGLENDPVLSNMFNCKGMFNSHETTYLPYLKEFFWERRDQQLSREDLDLVKEISKKELEARQRELTPYEEERERLQKKFRVMEQDAIALEHYIANLAANLAN